MSEPSTVYGHGWRDGWRGHTAFDELERARLEILNRAPAPNPPELIVPTRCRVVRPFFLKGNRVEVGQIVELPRHDAISLAAIGRVEIISQ